MKFKCKGVHLIINTIAAARTASLMSGQAAYCMQVHTTVAKLLKVRNVIPQAAWFSCKITLSHHLRPHYTPKVGRITDFNLRNCSSVMHAPLPAEVAHSSHSVVDI